MNRVNKIILLVLITTIASKSPIVQANIEPILANTKVLNVPIVDFYPGQPVSNINDLTQDLLNANNMAIAWGGKVSDGNNNYFDIRLIGNSIDNKDPSGAIIRPAGLLIRVQFIDRFVSDSDKFEIILNNKTYTTEFRYRNTNYTSQNGQVEHRCIIFEDCRGWTIDRLIPWTDLNGMPNQNDLWDFEARFLDNDGSINSVSNWKGKIRWGLPLYEGVKSVTDKKINIEVSEDANVGGNTVCGDYAYPDYFDRWGNTNFEKPIKWANTNNDSDLSAYAITMNEWDISDWPCFSKQLTKWSIKQIPANAKVTKAVMAFYHFGEYGYGNCYADNATKDTLIQVFELTENFNEADITWDSVPIPRENISRTIVPPARAGCNNNGTRDPEVNPYLREFDVTEIVKRALSENRETVSTLLYTSAGQYHSGKQFWSNKDLATNPDPLSSPGNITIFYTDSINITPSIIPSPIPTLSINPIFDVNKDGTVNLLDVITILAEIFK